MGEYQERPKRSSSNNNKNLPPIQAYEQYMYGGGFPEADRSPLPITPELIEQLEKEDEELFLRFGSRQVYNKPKKKEIPRHRLRRVQRTEATQVPQNEQDVRLKNKASISDKKDRAISDKRDKAISKDKTDTAISNEKRDIASFSQAEKLLEVLNLTIQKLPSALGSQLKALINPTSIAVMVGVLGAYTASHAVGVGFIADAVMGVSAGLFLGWQAIDVAKDLWGFAQYVNATTEAELDKAAEHLAKAITTVGFDVILGILTKKAAGKLGKNTNVNQADTDLVKPGSTGIKPLGGRSSIPVDPSDPMYMFGTHKGKSSGRNFNPDKMGLPISPKPLSSSKIKITEAGLDMVKKHMNSFDPDVQNQKQIQRFEGILSGEVKPTKRDLDTFAHELRESLRYKRIGYKNGDNPDLDYDIWNDNHTGTLEDYNLTDNDMYDLSTFEN